MPTYSNNQIFFGVISIIVLLSLIQWLLAIWIKSRLEKSIQHEYDKKLENYKFTQLQRQKAEAVARLFSKWIKYRGKESDYLEKNELLNFYEELNQTSLEISLWIKDEELLLDIMTRLQNKESAKDIRTIIGQIRKLILETKESKFDPQEITLWPTDEQFSKLFTPTEMHQKQSAKMPQNF